MLKDPTLAGGILLETYQLEESGMLIRLLVRVVVALITEWVRDHHDECPRL